MVGHRKKQSKQNVDVKGSDVKRVMKRFDYVCQHFTENGYVIDEFALFAKIVSRTDKTVTFERYMKFGKLKCRVPVTVPVSDFERYYTPMTDELYKKALKGEKHG